MNGTQARSFWRTVLTFSFVGPPIGAVVLLAPVAVQAILAGQLQSVALAVLIVVPFYGYVFGLLPAGITGVLSAAISPRFESWRAWAATSSVIGWLISALALSWTGLADDPAAKILNGFIGAVPALVRAWLSRKNRPLRNKPVQVIVEA